MTPIQNVEQAVTVLYAAHNPGRADWCDWLGENHVFVVAEYAVELARQYKGNEDLARAAALLHDIADTKMSRSASEHEDSSQALARELMQQAGFSEQDIHLTVDDAIRFHSCYDGHVPQTIEGKALATADSKAHLLTDFYVHAAWAFGQEGMSLQEVKQWVLKKIDRDFNSKIQFDEVRQESQMAYDSLKALFSR